MEAIGSRGLYRDSGKEHGNYYLGFRFYILALTVISIVTSGIC